MILQAARITLLKIEQAYCNDGNAKSAARASIARALGIGNGTLENLIRNRVKSISADVAAKIMALRAKQIEAEIARLTHERDLALQSYAAVDPGQVREMEVCLEKMRSLVTATGKGRVKRDE